MSVPVPWHLLPGPLVMLDLETTGVSATHHRIVELAAVRKAAGEPTRVLHTLVDHGERRVGASHVHGITRPMLDGAPTIDKVLPFLRELCTGATMVAHNASFEHRFLSAEMARCGGVWGMDRLCTLRLARRLHPERKGKGGHGLGGMARCYDVKVQAAHTALGDVRMMSAMFGQMLRRFTNHERLASALVESIRPAEHAWRWPALPAHLHLKPRWG